MVAVAGLQVAILLRAGTCSGGCGFGEGLVWVMKPALCLFERLARRQSMPTLVVPPSL